MLYVKLCIIIFVFLIQTITHLTASSCRCNGFISSEGGGECTTRYKGIFWCYINNEAECDDRRESQNNKGQNWSYQACQDKISPVSRCITKDGNACVFPFEFKGQVFNSCTKFESVNDKPWCATQVFKKLITNRWGICDMKTCTGEDDAEIDDAQPHTSRDCKVASLNDDGKGCVFPFNYKNKTYTKCTMIDSGKPWCATQVDHRGNIKNKGNCNEDISSADCFPDEFWNGITVYHEDEDGNIPCENNDDCPVYEKNTIRKILGLGKEWNPYMSCYYKQITKNSKPAQIKAAGVCTLYEGETPGCDVDYEGNPCKYDDNLDGPGCGIDYKGDYCFDAPPGGTPLRYTTSAAGQGWLPGYIDLTKPRINKKRKKLLSRVRGGCDDSTTCRRGDYCCSVVWAGSNRQFICPRTCFLK